MLNSATFAGRYSAIIRRSFFSSRTHMTQLRLIQKNVALRFSLKVSNLIVLARDTSVKVRWIPPKILMDHLIGCCYAAVALECSAKAYLMVDFWSGYDPMNMLFCDTHPDSSCNRWTPHKNTGKTFKNTELLLNLLWLYSDNQAYERLSCLLVHLFCQGKYAQ